MNIRKSILLRVRIAFLLFVVFGAAVIIKIGKIQFLEGEKWSELSEQITLRYREVNATRGNIYSDNGSLLATSLPEYRLCFDPTVAGDDIYLAGIDSLALLLSKHFGDRSKAYYKRRINDARQSGRQYLILNKELIRYQHKKKMTEWPIFREGRMRGGVIFEKTEKRFKPFKYLAFRTIGYLNENNYGAGLEYSFNNILSGKDGSALYQKMAGGNWKPIYDGTETRPQDGLDITTTLNVNIQDVTESALLTALKQHQADYGCVIVMEVKTGEIKAISNLSKSGDHYAERYNYAVGSQGLTEPGSTFKLLSMMALLEETPVQLTDSIDTGKGRYKFYDRTMSDHKHGGYGMISVRDAFEVSSNIAISRLIDEHFGLKPERFVDFIKETGISQPLGFQMIGEGIPYIKSPKDPTWSGTTLPWMSIGYELKLTPLQILTLYNAVANDGKLIQPIIVKNAKKADKVHQVFEPAIINSRICSEETLKQLRSLLEGVVERGTAKNIRNAHYKIAGKTGTAQKVKEGGGYSRNYYTSFAGYFPADQPKYSCIVVIDNPRADYQYGSDVAAPVFKTIADNIYARDLELQKPVHLADQSEEGVFPVIQAGMQDDLELICRRLHINNKSEGEKEWVKAAILDNEIVWNDLTAQPGKTPDVRGMRMRDALYLLENAGFNVLINGVGRVVTQSLPPGAAASRGTAIEIKLEKWPN